MRIKHCLAIVVLVALSSTAAVAQNTSRARPNNSGTSVSSPWSVSLTLDGYVVPHAEFFLSPTVAADRQWLHLEGRYNYEDQNTGSVWIGRTFSCGQKVVFEVTPMVGGVFGNTNGIAPGYQAFLSYKQLELFSSGEYVFDTSNQNGSFFYSWPQLTYSPVSWFHAGLVAQRTKTYHTSLDTQRGFLLGFSLKGAEFTTFVFNPGRSDPTLVFEAHWSFFRRAP